LYGLLKVSVLETLGIMMGALERGREGCRANTTSVMRMHECEQRWGS